MIFTDKEHDYDATWDVWEKLYDIIYKDTFGYLFDFEDKEDKETNAKCKRLYIKIDRKRQPVFAEKFPHFKMSGDCIFNFNDKKIDIFRKIIREQENELLVRCKNNHHSLLNFSFMPITGGLNNTKGTIKCENGVETYSFDRPDVLIAELQKYYSGEEEDSRSRVFMFSRTNKEALQWYLDIFAERGIYGYCNDVYLIDDKEMIKRFIDLAKKPICNPETAVEYMTLACDYWQMKKSKLQAFGINIF